MRVALIMPSTFHLRSTIHKELPNGAEMLLYCGIVDLDAEPHHAGSKQALKANIEEAIRSGASVEEVCGACPDFGSVVKAAQVMCAKLREKGFAPICWFTGGKGVRVAWFDPACYMRYRKGDKDVSTRVRDVFFKDYLGADCLAQIRALCELDKCVYEAGKGVKSDLRRHQDTGFWPFLMDFGDADEGFRSMCAKRETRDEALCDQIVAFWSRVLTNLPESWEAANTVPGGAKAIADVGGVAKKRHALELSSAAGATCTTKKAKTAQRVQTVNAAGKEHTQAKLAELAAALVQIHPDRGSEYSEWITFLFAVTNHMGGARDADVDDILDAFSCIRDNYKGADDVTQRCNQIKNRDDSQSRVTMGTLVHLAREHPALFLKTQPTPEECVAVREARNKKTVLLQLLKLLLLHMDPAKTNWCWLLQACACLVSDRQALLAEHQESFIARYAQIGVVLNPGDVEAACRQPRSRVYLTAVVKYIEDMFLLMPASDDEDLERETEGSSDIPKPKEEDIYFERPSLSDANKRRVNKSIKSQFLDAMLFVASLRRVLLVESCTGTGKTTSVTNYARKTQMPIISICTVKTQVEQHVNTFKKDGICTKSYADVDPINFVIGEHSLVTTIDSLERMMRSVMKHDKQNIGRYILCLDEFHSITQYIFFSATLKAKRKEVMANLRWLLRHAGKVIVMDNAITDVELAVLDSALAPPDGMCEIDFIQNQYQKYTKTRAVYQDDDELLISMMLTHIQKNEGFTVPCNTKKQARRLHKRLTEEAPEGVNADQFKLYTSDQHLLSTDVDGEWSNNAVIYSPTITTGIDFNPETPQNVYLFIEGEKTVSPATALQMITRNRNIDTVYICASKMINKPQYRTYEEMCNELDAACKSLNSSRDIETLHEWQDQRLDSDTNDIECTIYSDNAYSTLYKKALFHDNVMRSSFLYNLDGLLESRGFEVHRQTQYVAKTKKESTWKQECDVLNRQDDEADFKAYIEDVPLDPAKKRRFDEKLAVLKGMKSSEITRIMSYINFQRLRLRDLVQNNPDGLSKYIVDIFTDESAFTHFLNLRFLFYTDKKLEELYKNLLRKDYAVNILDDCINRVILLRRMLDVWNHNLPEDVHLKLFDLTIKQSSYDEDETIEVSNGIMQQYNVKRRDQKPQPGTRKELMKYIFSLARDVFGKHFCYKKRTRNAVKSSMGNVYNYETNSALLQLWVELRDWSLIDTCDIEPTLIDRYGIEERKQKALQDWDHERRLQTPTEPEENERKQKPKTGKRKYSSELSRITQAQHAKDDTKMAHNMLSWLETPK